VSESEQLALALPLALNFPDVRAELSDLLMPNEVL
jgi:hypothetical protein